MSFLRNIFKRTPDAEVVSSVVLQPIEAVVEKAAVDRAHYDDVYGKNVEVGRVETQPTQHGDITHEIAAKIYTSIPAINRAVRIGAAAASEAILKVMMAPYGDTAKAREVTRGEPVTMLRWVNKNMGPVEFISTVYSWAAICGEAFIAIEETEDEYKDISPFSLYPLNPALVTLKPHRDMGVAGVWYGAPGSEIFIPTKRLIHLKNFNPHDAWHGISDLNAASYDVQIAQFRKKQLSNYYANAAIIQGVVSSDDEIGADEIARLRRDFHEQHAGAKRSYRLMVLDHGMKYEPIKGDSADETVDELLRNLDATHAMVMGVPIALMRQDTNAGSKATLIEYEALMWKQTILPFLRMLAEVLTKRLCMPITRNANLYIVFNTRHVDALRLQELDRMRMETAAIIVGRNTVNELRGKAGEDLYTGDAADYGNLPKPVWDAQQAKSQAEARASASLTLPGSEGGRDQSETGEAQMVDTTGQRSMDAERLLRFFDMLLENKGNTLSDVGDSND